MKPESLPEFLLLVVVIVVLVFALSRTGADPDLWGHVRFGQDILAAQSIPRHDPYSFTSDQPWVNHEWLAEVFMAAAYDVAGGPGLITLKWVLSVSTLGILWLALRHARVFPPVAAGLMLVAAIGLSPLITTIRPQLFSMLICAAQFVVMSRIDRGRSRLFLWMLPMLALWANLHGGWIVGAGVLLLWSAAAAVEGVITWPWTVAGVAMALAASAATPYGFELWRFLWNTVGLGRADIEDWQPILRAPSHLIPWALTALLVVVAWGRRGRVPLSRFVPPVVVGILALLVVRLEGFFTLAAVIMLAPCFAGFGPARLPLSRQPTRGDAVAVGTVCLAALVASGLAVRGRLTCVNVTGSFFTTRWAPEAEAVLFLRDNPVSGRLLSWFDYGELAIWHLSPKLRVSYDGRRETVYSDAVQAAHRRFYSSSADASYATDLKADYVWLPRGLPVIAPLERDGWVEIFRGARSVVLARAGGPYRQPPPWTGPRCFPGP